LTALPQPAAITAIAPQAAIARKLKRLEWLLMNFLRSGF
jgi:hypothetical protein